MRKVLVSALAAAVLVVLVASAQGTAALWRAEGALNPGALTTGSLSLGVGKGAAAGKDFVFDTLDSKNLAPGGFTQAPLTISNTGSVALNYTLAGAASATTPQAGANAALAAAVELSVHATGDSAACGKGTPTPGEPLYEGPLAGAAFAQARGLQPERSEVLCIRVALPADAPQAAAAGKVELVLSWRGDQL